MLCCRPQLGWATSCLL